MKPFAEFIEPFVVRDVLNDNPNLIEIFIPKHDKAWLDFRKYGIGASEMGVVVGVNAYTLLPQLVEEKVGTRDGYKPSNEAMFSGLMAESGIIARWQHYDGTELGYIDNYNSGKIIRSCQPVNTYIINHKYPWMFVSLDARVEANQSHLSGVMVPYEWPLELKTIREYEAKRWVDGVPAMYRVQIQTQMLVTETEYAELAVLQDGTAFKVIPFKKDEQLQEIILTKSQETYILIQQLRELQEEKQYFIKEGNVREAQRLQAEYENRLPLPFGEDAGREYYSDKMVKERDEFLGSKEDFAIVKERMRIKEMEKALEEQRDLCENLLRRRFVLEKCEYMNLGDGGLVRYYQVAGRKTFQLGFQGVKNMVDAEAIKNEVKLKLFR